MNYAEWFTAQTPERQELSQRLMEASRLRGEATRNGDKELAAKYQADIQQIYKEIGEDDG